MNIKVTGALCAWLALGLALPASALDPDREFFQYGFRYPGEELNLPTDMADVQEDLDGFLWLATSRGLIKFDGLEAVTYRVSRYPELLSNLPTRLFVDSSNRLFVGSERGTSVFDGERFQTVLSGNKGSTQAHAFAEGPGGVVWIGTEQGLWQYSGDRVDRVELAAMPEHVRSLLWRGDTLYIGGRGRIFALKGSEAAVIELPESFARAHVRDLEFHQGRIWGATRSGLVRLDGDTAVAVVDERLDGLSFDVLLSGRDDSLWFASRRTLGRFLPNGEIELPGVEDVRLGYVPEITQLFEDSHGRHWHTSRVFGVAAVMDTQVNRFSYTEGMLSTNATALTATPEGIIYVATDQGISTIANSVVSNIIAGDFSLGLAIRAMTVDDAGDLWLGTASELRRYSQRNGEWQEVDERIELAASVNSLARGANGDMWVATDSGVYRTRDGESELLPNSADSSVESLFFDSQGALWLGTDSGVARLQDGALTESSIELPEPVGTVVSISQMPSGGIVAATADHGILMRVDDRWMRFGEQEGLPPEPVIGIEARGQYLWIATAGGLFRASMPNGNSTDVSQFDVQAVAASSQYRAGFTTNCCRGRNASSVLLTNNELMVTSDDGVVSLDADVTVMPNAAPRAYVKAITHAGNRLPIVGVDGLTLDPQEPGLQIDYSAIELAQASQVRFRYRMLGLSDVWVEADDVRSAHFLNLPPGDFVFELQASLYPRSWPVESTRVAFTRPPLLTETAAFRLGMWALALVIGCGLIWAWLAAARSRHRQIEQRIKERTQDLRGVNKELKVANKDLQLATQTDPLTGLVNRRYFDVAQKAGILGDEVPETGMLLMLDIDFFKRVNDSYGHSAGDDVLRQFSDVLQSATRQSDLVARWGGEEFLVICQCPNDGVGAMLDRIGESVRGASFRLTNEQRLNLTCSIGAIRYPLWPGDNFDRRFPAFLELADAALYAVKMNGRDGWALLESDLSASNDAVEVELMPGRAARKLNGLLQSGSLRWRASREEVSLSFTDTVTRLRAMKSAQR